MLSPDKLKSWPGQSPRFPSALKIAHLLLAPESPFSSNTYSSFKSHVNWFYLPTGLFLPFYSHIYNSVVFAVFS